MAETERSNGGEPARQSPCRTVVVCFNDVAAAEHLAQSLRDIGFAVVVVRSVETLRQHVLDGDQVPVVDTVTKQTLVASGQACRAVVVKDDIADIAFFPLVLALARSRSEFDGDDDPVCLATAAQSLSAREQQVLALALCEYSNKEIGRMLSISARTVEVYRRRALDKMRSRSLLQLARRLFESEWSDAGVRERAD